MRRNLGFRSIGGTTAAALLLLLAGCGHRAADKDSESAQLNEADATVEDVSPDSLTAPENMPLDEESGNADDASGADEAATPQGNGIAPARGGKPE